MRIKMVPTKIGKPVNIIRADHAFPGNELVANIQFFIIFFKWMDRVGVTPCMLLIDPGDGCDRSRRSLYGNSLHIMLYSPDSTHLLPSAGMTRTAMNEQGQWRTMTR